MRILVVEDEARVADFLSRGLKAERHTVTIAHDGPSALDLSKAYDFDIIILDMLLPGMHGLEVCQTLRQRGIACPIMILSALDAVKDRIEGLRLGADDYMTKPFSFDELLARIDALARRPPLSTDQPNRVAIGSIVFDRDALSVWDGDVEIKMTAKELAIFELLLSSPGKVFSRERILSNVWGSTEDPMTNIVDVYLARLRKKFAATPSADIFETVRGLGYRVCMPDKK